MSVPDPDEAPTRHGEDPTRQLPSEERTVPARPPGPTPPRDAEKPGGRPAPAPARAPAGPADPLLGHELGGCRLERVLGRGAMGTVYKARQLKLDRDVAVKVIRPEMMTDQRMLKRFEVEARTVGKFNSAHVVMVHDVGFESGVHYLVMEFVQGKNLRDHVKLLAGGRLPVGEALPLLRQAIKGLEEAQRLRVIHRDVKPDNLMITDRGVLKIADFGIAKPLQEDFSMTLTSELVGTPLYMSPEQCQGEAELDFRSDMYSLGATFYYLLTGEPPIRASSVYELIQTKTKLAHLCLWKALPGLAENNPLSRVIERMTSLDREDRYGSYEELLNDLVLVEHGQTIQVGGRLAGGKGKAKGKAAPRRGRLIALAAGVIVLAGGAYAWHVATAPPATPPADAGKRAAEQMRGLWARLGETGPSPTLRDEAGRVAATREQVAERDRLLAEIEAGMGLQQELAKVQPPKTPAPPFDDVRAHFAAIDAAAAKCPTGPELASWRTRAVAAARAEDALGQLAVVQLTTAWAQWQGDRTRTGGDAARIGELSERLDGIERARASLLALVPAQRDTVQAALSDEALAAARRDLAAGPVMPVDIDLAPSLQTMAAELAATGPSLGLLDRANSLKPTRKEQIEARQQLLNDIDRAAKAEEQAKAANTSQYPEAPEPPFDRVVEYWQALDRALQPVRGTDGQLPAWAVQRRADLRRDGVLQDKVVAACTAMYTRWQQRAAAGGADTTAELAALRAAKARAIELFPASKDVLEQQVPDARLAAAEAGLALAKGRQQWFADLEQLQRQAGGVLTLADWNREAAKLTASVKGLGAGAAAFPGDAEVAAALQRAAAAVERWATAATRLATLDKHLGAGELKAADGLARVAASGTEGRAEFLAATEVVTTCAGAFDTLERTLAVPEAVTALQQAREKARAATFLPLGEQRLAGWIDALQRLQQAAAGMVPIPGGRPKGSLGQVGSFFLAATECSGTEFARFLGELRAKAGGIADPQQRLAAVADRLPNLGITADRLGELLARDVKAGNLPVENVTWYAAAACAAWQGRTLPSAAEWALAAFGDGGKYEYPWGNGWSADSRQRNLSNQNAVEVDAGGLSWRQADGVRIHHLGGNVAEWLAAEPGARVAFLAGGRYSDRSETSLKEQAGGRPYEADKSDGRKGFGFRTALRPRQFPGLEWPR